MFGKFFKKKEDNINNSILIAALLVHAAKIDDNYTIKEKEIIKKALIDLKLTEANKSEELLVKAETKEQDANQIIEFTRAIKKNSMTFRIKVIEILWKIIYSDNRSDNYESNLIRRVCGLLYVSDKQSGEIKIKIKKLIEQDI
tara:strand:+ start:293 stop:721 length:429 start_codon:yes stop_codon:yes gene_type:complete